MKQKPYSLHTVSERKNEREDKRLNFLKGNTQFRKWNTT